MGIADPLLLVPVGPTTMFQPRLRLLGEEPPLQACLFTSLYQVIYPHQETFYSLALTRASERFDCLFMTVEKQKTQCLSPSNQG
jgi:hypothetical protein